MGINPKEKLQHNQTGESNHKKKRNKRKILDGFIIFFLSVTLIAGITGFFILAKMVSGIDTQKDIVTKIKSKEPSRIYDNKNVKFTDWGGESRENVKYSQIPQSTIDAFLSIEDSRYFSHNGFDLPRFISSAFNNFKAGSLSQGGSTLTMQAIDNFITKPQEEKDKKEGNPHSKLDTIESKIKEIYMSIVLEGEMSKEEVITQYLNQINFGAQARGIQRGAQYYFGKDVEELNLSESAFLAGVINAPNYFNPYAGKEFYKAATSRRDETLYQMLNHGYISETEYKLAKSVKLAFQVVGAEKMETDPYYAFAYEVALDVKELTGVDPAITPMDIYTTLDLTAQKEANDLSQGKNLELPDNKYFQYGFTMMNNQTGEIIAIGPGLKNDYSSSAWKNRADIPHQTGSSIKPIIDYALTFDKLGWATSHTLDDKKGVTINGGISYVNNANGLYQGPVSYEQAIGQSLNTTAVLAYRELIKVMGVDGMMDYLDQLGFDEATTKKLSENFAIGGGDMEASPTQMAAAFSIFANGGKYIEPHTIREVKLRDGSKEYKPKYEETQVISEQAAYLMSDLLEKAVTGKYANWLQSSSVGKSGYPIYGKTGTSDNGDYPEITALGIPKFSMRDEWLVNYTTEYTIATWSGFDSRVDSTCWITQEMLELNNPGWINRRMLDTMKKNPTKIKRPSGISDITHMKNVFPYVKAPSGSGGKNVVTGMIETKFAKLDALEVTPPTNLTSFSVAQASLEGSSLVFTFASYPGSPNDKMTQMFGDIVYKVEITVDGKIIKTLSFDTPNGSDNGSIPAGKTATVCGFYAYKNGDSRSNEICKTISVNANEVDYTYLYAMLSRLNTFSQADYTADSYNNLKKAIATATVLVANQNATQEQIDAQLIALELAEKKLVKKTEPSDPTDPD